MFLGAGGVGVSRLIKIAGWDGAPRASVIFVHGLAGHAYDTWRRAPNNDTFWPLWLAQDVEGISVFTVAYEAPATNWLGTSMPLPDRAVNILEYLLSEPGLKAGPIAFICHSLGGLIVKQMLLDLKQQMMSRPEAADFFQRITQVVFAATPHTGAQKASLLQRLKFLAWPSTIAGALVANDPTLRSINVSYRRLADERRDVLEHRVFYETQDTGGGRIVDEASADPGLPGDPPVPIDADHISIVKPADRSSLLYARTRDFVAKSPACAGQAGALAVLPLPEIKSEHSLNFVPMLVRVTLIALLVLVACGGGWALLSRIGPSKEQIEQIQKPLTEQLSKKDAQIADLTKLLLERNPAAGPGAQQAVGAAVGSIATGAAEGDARLQHALDLLKENEIADATQLLKTFAEDKTAHAEQATTQAEKDRTDAAIAYRNLGAIAGLRDPKQALEAYEKALTLDPDDLDSLLWAGWIQIDHGDLNEAQARFERALTLAKTDDQVFYRYWALLGLGDIKKKRGDLNGALKSYRDGLAIADRLSQSDPGNTKRQRDLSASYERVGDVQRAQGDLDGALKSYRDRLAIADRLAKSDPGNTEWQRDLSVSYNKVGDVQVAQGDLAGALKSFSDGLAIINHLATSDPRNAGWRRDLSVSLNKVGDVRKAQGELAGALKSYNDGLEIIDRLAKSDPGNAQWQYDLGISNERIGDVQVAQGDLAGALTSYRAKFAIIDRLAKSDPGNAQWQYDLGISNERIGAVQVAQGDLAGALTSYRAKFAIIDRLAKSDPGNAGWQRDLSVSYEKVGEVQVAQGDLAGALKSFSDSLAIRERLAQSDPGNAGWRRDLSVSFEKIGDVQRAQGDLGGALQSYRNSLAIRERLAQSDPGNAEWRRDLAVSYAHLADAYGKSNETAKALEALGSGRAIIAKLVAEHPDWAEWKRDLAWFDARIAEQNH
jgi:tetratricopeptide (TPR) repeat protein